MVNSTLGNFIERHAEAVALINNVSVIHVCVNYNQKEKLIIDVKNNKNVLSLIAYIKTSGFLKINYFIAFVKAYQLLYKSKGKPEIAHLHVIYPSGLFALYLKYFKRINYIITEHWTGYLTSSNQIKNKWIHKLIANNASFICPVSENLAMQMKNIGFTNKFVKVPNVVDTDLFTNATKNNIKKRIIHISTLDDNQKNVTGLINVIAELLKKRNDFVFEIISDGNQSSAQALCRNKNVSPDQIIFHGLKPIQEVAQILKNCDLFVLFSNYENLPCVISEALCSGVPVISTNVGGINEMITPENGILISKGNEAELKNAITSYLDGDTVFNSFEIRKKAVQEYSFEKIAATFNSIYEECV